MAAPKAPSESATATSGAFKPPAAPARAFSVDRSAKDTTGEKVELAQPTARAGK
jgi:hypothetical protein